MNHISSFVVGFIDDVFPQLEFDREEKKYWNESIPLDSMLKLFVYAKIQHIDDFLDMFVMILSHQNIQFKDISKYGCYYESCKNCEAQNKCYASLQTHKTITEYLSIVQKAMKHQMEKEEYKEEYTKRSIVEEPFGILKQQYHIEKQVVIEIIKTEERINLDTLAYNLVRLYK